MNILIVNQPLNNRGDESAHKALVRSLQNELPHAYIIVLWVGGNMNSIEQYAVKSDYIQYVNLKPQKGFRFLFPSVVKNGHYWMLHLHPTTRKILNYYKNSDWIICAPGGICMGGFQSWGHLFYLKIAQYLGKPIAYFGRSFGPFPTQTVDNCLFKEISLEMLRYFSFLSIRDSKTEKLAKEYEVKYESTVDTAFLDSPHMNLPDELLQLIEGGRYVVFVPNLLIWHYKYKNRISKETILDFYSKVYEVIITFYSCHRVLLLPQTFNYGTYEGDDINFFRELKRYINDDKLVIVPDIYSSDIQQTVISGAKCVIGARYHSIVFAINNAVPFVALSYEHKISGLLERLNLQNHMVDIEHAFETDASIKETVCLISEKIKIAKPDFEKKQEAKDMAKNCLNKLLAVIKQ